MIGSILRRLVHRCKRLLRERNPSEIRIRDVPESYPSLGWTTPPREQILWLALHYIASSRLVGDYAEFGVWRGDTFATAYHFCKHLTGTFPALGSVWFHAFDSFEGFPDLHDDDVYPQFEKGGRAFSLDQFNALIAQRQVPIDRITVTKGWFSETLRPGAPSDSLIADQSLAIAYVDCDLYESTRDVLPYLKRKMTQGGVIIFDDWFCFAGHPLKGEQKACREFLATNPEVVLVPFQRFGWHGHSFIFHMLDEAHQQRFQGILL